MLSGTGHFAVAAFTTFLTVLALRFLRLPEKRGADFGEPSLVSRARPDTEEEEE
jgi:hypothetical protein